eukprot:4120899-Heterocapsa_arctica.AAC.1
MQSGALTTCATSTLEKGCRDGRRLRAGVCVGQAPCRTRGSPPRQAATPTKLAGVSVGHRSGAGG